MRALTDQTVYTALSPAPIHVGLEGIGPFLAGGAILAFILLALVIQVSLRRDHRFSMFFGLLSVLFSAAAMALCLVGPLMGTLVAKPTGDPQETVTGFFDALCAGDTAGAYGYLNGYTSLGLEEPAAEAVGQAMMDALKASYSYELSGSCAVQQLSAHQTVLFTYLDLTAIAPDVKEETALALEEAVKTHPEDEIYDENQNYLPQVTQEAYAAAVDKVLAQAERYITTASLQLELTYTGGRWLLTADRSLLNAITGGTY